MTSPAFGRLLRDARGNVAMMFGLLVVPLVFTVGMGIDYGAASRLSSKLHAAADAASLAAVTPQM
jgi:Flp pilus assembly protein TadG